MCIDDDLGELHSRSFVHVILARGAVYTIHEVTDEFAVPACQLIEFTMNIETNEGLDRGFLKLARFRPVLPGRRDHSTNIEEFV